MKALFLISSALFLASAFGCSSETAGGATARRIDYGPPPAAPAPLEEKIPSAKDYMYDKALMLVPTEPGKAPPGLKPAPPVQQFTSAQVKTPKPAAGAQATPGKAPNLSGDAVQAGQGLRNAHTRYPAWDYLGSLANAKRGTKERLSMLMWKKNMDLYKAAHNNKGPKTHEEAMRLITDDWMMDLPDPPAGQKYVYDPATEDLYLDKQ